METTADKEESTLADTQGSPAPNWDEVPFDVACARCGHDLRGLTEPRCPACELAFDWADAVPLERLTCLHCAYHLYGLSVMRCPECGESFTWADVLADYHRRKNPLFEYQWRRQPIRSLVRTWLWAVWPPNLWRRVDLHDPPRVGPLLLWVFLSLAVFYLCTVLHSGVQDWIIRSTPWGGGLPGAPLPWRTLPTTILSAFSEVELYMVALVVLTWVVASLAALMVFRQSMRLCKVRNAHVVRVWAYATPSMLAVGLLLAVAPHHAVLMSRGWPLQLPLGLVVAGAALCHVIWSTARAYRIYLRMPHSLAVAIAAQTIAVLAALTLLLGVPLALL